MGVNPPTNQSKNKQIYKNDKNTSSVQPIYHEHQLVQELHHEDAVKKKTIQNPDFNLIIATRKW